MFRTVAVACALLAVAATASAQAVRDVTYSDRQVIPVKTQVRFTTVLVLPEGEEILDFVCGDKDFWIVSGAQHLAYVKPAKEKAATNLNLVTASGRVYSFLLRESTDAPDLKVYVTRDDTTAGVGGPTTVLHRSGSTARTRSPRPRERSTPRTKRRASRSASPPPGAGELDERVAQVRVAILPRRVSRFPYRWKSRRRRRSSSRRSSMTARRPTSARGRRNCQCSTRSATAHRTS